MLLTGEGNYYAATNVDAKTTQDIALGPLNTRRWQTIRIVVRFKTVTSMSATFKASFGSNGGTFNNLVADGDIGTAGSVTNDGFYVTITNPKSLDVSTDPLTMRINTGATGTTCNVDVLVFGVWGEP